MFPSLSVTTPISHLVTDSFEPEIVQEKCSDLTISDADSDVLFDEERKELSVSEYEELKVSV